MRIVVPYPPEACPASSGSLEAERLAETRQQVIVESRPKATYNIGADLVAKSAPDGYDQLVTPLDIATNPGACTRT